MKPAISTTDFGAKDINGEYRKRLADAISSRVKEKFWKQVKKAEDIYSPPSSCRPVGKTYAYTQDLERSAEEIASDFCETFPGDECGTFYIPIIPLSPGVEAFCYDDPLPYQIVFWFNGAQIRDIATLWVLPENCS